MKRIIEPPEDWIIESIRSKLNIINEGSLEITKNNNSYTSRILYLRSKNYLSEKRFFLKISRANANKYVLDSSENEVLFYSEIAPLCKTQLIKCSGAEWNKEKEQGYILLDDLSKSHHSPEWPTPPNIQLCESAIDYLAEFHAFWIKANFESMDITKKIKRGVIESQTNKDLVSKFTDFISANIGNIDLTFFDKYLNSKHISERLCGMNRFNTIISGDAHGSNFLYSKDNKAIPCDFQFFEIAPAIQDLENMVVMQWSNQRCEKIENNLLQRYMLKLKEKGIYYPWENLWEDYRLSFMRHLVYAPAKLWSSNVPAIIWWPLLERGVKHWHRLECNKLLG